MSEITHIEKRLDSHASEIKEIRSLLSAIPGQIQAGINEAVKQAINSVGARRSSDVSSSYKKNGNGNSLALSLAATLLILCFGFVEWQMGALERVVKSIKDDGQSVITELKDDLLQADRHAAEKVDEVVVRINEHIGKQGHPESVVAQIKGNKDLIQGVDDKLQLELAKLDEKLQMEIGHAEGKATDLHEDVEQIRVWQEDHDLRVIGLNSAQNVRLDHLEDKIKFWEQTGFFNDVAKGNIDSVQNEKLRWLEKNDMIKGGGS